jgi:O-antigen ligase
MDARAPAPPPADHGPHASRSRLGDDRGTRIGVRGVAVAAALAWLLLGAAAVAAGDPAGIARSGAVLVAVAAAVVASRWRPFRLLTVALLAVNAAALTGATLVAGAGPAGSGDAARLALFTGNPNVLGAALVTAMAAWAAVAPGRRWVWWLWPLVGLAVLHTGSRTSGGALLAAGAVWLSVQAYRWRPRLVLAPLVAIGVLAAAAVAWQRGVVELTPNLLASPSDLTHAEWRSLAERVEIVPDAAPGPYEGTRAQRLVGQATERGRGIVHQSIGRSETGVPYVASVYLRAETPQRVVLTSHLARVTCEVGTTWHRCVTPVGYGDDHAQRQIHIQTHERGGSLDVYVFGAQYERGDAATPFLDARPAWVPQAMVNRYDLRRVTFVPADRVEAWTAGLAIARAAPWFGVGQAASADAFRARTADGVNVSYAHNLAIELLAVHGVVGLVGAALVVAALLAALGGRGWARLAPLLVGTVLLNTWDVTLFDGPVFVPAVLGLAFWAGRPAAGP